MSTASASRVVRATDTVLNAAVLTSWVAVGAVVVVSVMLRLLGVDWSGAAAGLVVVGLLVALPHGAVDHLAPRWRPSRSSVAVVPLMVGYVSLAAIAWALLRSWPLVGLGVLLTLSVVHFGLGEATFHALRRADGRSGRSGRSERGAGIGVAAVAVLLPILIYASDAAPYLHAMAPSWDGRLPRGWETGAIVAVLAVAAVTGLTSLHHGQRLVAAELLLVVVLALAAPPAVAVATYVGWWHAVRHTAVLVSEERAITGPGALRSLTRRAALPTVAAVLTLGGLWWWAAGDALTFVSEQIWLLAALTVPHGLVVAWLDRTRGPAGAHLAASSRPGLP